MKKIIFDGVGTAIVTPFNNGEVDYNALEILINKQLDANISAIILLGTTGEPATLTLQEREKIILFAKNVIGNRAKLIIGCGSNNTQSAINLYRQAESYGADGALIVTPYYNKCTQDGLKAHYRAISDAGNLPIIVYNVPGRTGVNIMPETMAELCKIKNVVGLKEASGNITQILDYFNLCGDKIAIYSGEDALNSFFLLLGAKGTISVASNVFPKMCNKIIKYAKNKEYEKMLILQNKMQQFIKALFLEVNPIPVKAGLFYLGLCKNELRLPLTSMTNNNYNKLKHEIDLLIGQENDSL